MWFSAQPTTHLSIRFFYLKRSSVSDFPLPVSESEQLPTRHHRSLSHPPAFSITSLSPSAINSSVSASKIGTREASGQHVQIRSHANAQIKQIKHQILLGFRVQVKTYPNTNNKAKAELLRSHILSLLLSLLAVMRLLIQVSPAALHRASSVRICMQTRTDEVSVVQDYL